MISLLALWISSDVFAQIRIEIPHRRPNPGSDGPGLRDLAAGLLALKDGYDRSRRGFVCVLAYEDANGNGKRDRDEAPLPGWSFNITDAAGATAASGATDGKGRFCNEQPLTPGGYVVSQARVEGWVNREPGGAVASKPVTLPANQSVTVLFGNCQGERCGGRGPNQPARPEGPTPPKFTGRICVTKFEDLNGNGVRDGQEWVLPGWTINVLNSAGTLVALGTTNMQGEFCTQSSLNPGAYEVSEVVSGGWINTSPGGPSHILPLSLGQTATWTFANQRIPSTGICITKFNDLNGDGVKQANEPKLPGWVFTIVGPGGTVLAPNSATSTTVCHSGPFAAGATTVTETAQPGWAPTTPGGASQTFTLVPTHNKALLFGNRQLPATARVCVRKYKDANGNGQRDPGEPLMPGWIFSVKTPAGAMLAFGTTDAQGQWCSSATLPSGLVSVIETTKPGWTSTDPGGAAPAKPATLVPGQTANLLFGNRQPPPPPAMGQLCVAKFQDLDSDGLYTSSDLSLPGWSFTLAGPSGPITLTTGAVGTACTPVSLLLGTYTVTEVLQPGWTSTSPGGLAPQRTRVVTAGANGAGLMFGNIHADRGQICVNKYQDLNRDRKRSPNDPPLAGFSFQVLNAAGAVVATGVTDAQGRWCSSQALPVGVYSVVEAQQPGWVPTDPSGPPMMSPPYDKPATLTATRGAELWFGNIRSGRACVTKYNDLNGNGRRDPGEPPLAGWDFRFAYVSWGAATSVHIVTDASGRACVDLPPGATQQVVETPQPGWAPTEPTTVLQGSNGLPWARRAFTIVEGQTVELVFGNRSTAPAAPGSVCLVKYSDLDQDGVRDPGEPGLPGWVFNLTTASGAPAGSITTGPQGRACKELTPGAYVALEVTQPGWTNTDPPGATPQKPFTVVSGQSVALVFGNHQKPPPTPVGQLCVGKFHDLNGDGASTPSEPMLPGWQFTVTGPSGPITLTTGANGRACTAANLLLGTYVVTEVMQPGWINTAPGAANPQQTIVLTAVGIPIAKFGNRRAPPPPRPRLTISKTVDVDCGTVQGIANPCVFRIRITNVDAVAYVGPVSFSDSVGFNGNIVIAGSTTLVAPLPPGWTCNASGPPNLCTGNVNLAPGQFVDVVLTMNLAHVVMPKENCVRLTAPIAAGPACVSF